MPEITNPNRPQDGSVITTNDGSKYIFDDKKCKWFLLDGFAEYPSDSSADSELWPTDYDHLAAVGHFQDGEDDYKQVSVEGIQILFRPQSNKLVVQNKHSYILAEMSLDDVHIGLLDRVIDRKMADAKASSSRYSSLLPYPPEEGWPTETARVIFEELIPEWAESFLRKQADYGEHANLLGAAGQFADMYRKFTKLRKAMWDDEPLVGEQSDEVLLDLIGHSLLALMFVRNSELTVYPKGGKKK